MQDLTPLELRQAAKALVRQPGFTLVASLTLALGIGANTAVFSLVNGILLHPLPYWQADRLAVIWEQRLDAGARENVVGPANFLRWRDRSRTFAAMAAVAASTATLTGAGEPEELSGQAVNAALFPMLGAPAALGRVFGEEEDRPGHDKVVLLSHRLWSRRFGQDPSIVGRSITLAGETRTVVGVMPAGFSVLSPDCEFWTPVAFSSASWTPRGRYLRVIGRLRDGVSLAAAQAELDAIAARLRSELPGFDEGWGVRVVSLNDQAFGEIRPVLFVLFGAVGIVLLLACVNVANLLLNRGLDRQRELALRAALGAGRGRLVRLLVTEGGLLALLGGCLAVLFAWLSLDWLLAAAGALLSLPRPAGDVTFDFRVLAFALAASLGAVLIFALAPALSLSRMPLESTLRDGGSRGGHESRSRRRVRAVLAVSQLALAFTLLAGAGLMIRSIGRLLAVDGGFRPDNVLTMRVLLQQSKYDEPGTRAAFVERLLDETTRLPGIATAGATSGMPFRGFQIATRFSVGGRPFPGEASLPVADVRIIAGSYFEAMGIPLVRGRPFEPRDGEEGRGAAIVSASLVRASFPDEDPLGRTLRVRLGPGEGIEGRIVGVVGDVRHEALDREPRPTIYLPNRAAGFPLMGVVFRTAGSPSAMAAQVVGQVRRLDPDVPVSQVQSMDEVVGASVGRRRFVMLLLAAFAGLALTVATVGVYGVLSYSAARRIPEMGIRAALGASPGRLLRQLLGESLVLVWTGVALGVGMGIGAGHLLGKLLYGVPPGDPLTFALVALVLAAVATAAVLVPARRACRVDPVKALRMG